MVEINRMVRSGGIIDMKTLDNLFTLALGLDEGNCVKIASNDNDVGISSCQKFNVVSVSLSIFKYSVQS